ncbi:MAG: hypothetical protein J2P47_08305 [Acetobacteraceae bacterium]|nr:hypothetical protein [Acetobacteraceae bacterium]
MRTVLHALWAFSIAALLAGCVSRPPARMAAAPVPLSPSQTVYGSARTYDPYRAFDGAYRATVVLDAIGPGIDRGWCGAPGRVMLWVTNSRFTLDLRHPTGGTITPNFIVDVAPNGMFQSQASTAIFAGQIVGPTLTGLINGAGCRYTVTATRI